eukprot:1320757-Rhodomonas_salina.1
MLLCLGACYAMSGTDLRACYAMSGTGLRACYAMSGTDRRACYAMSGTDLRACYAMSGTDLCGPGQHLRVPHVRAQTGLEAPHHRTRACYRYPRP